MTSFSHRSMSRIIGWLFFLKEKQKSLIRQIGIKLLYIPFYSRTTFKKDHFSMEWTRISCFFRISASNTYFNKIWFNRMSIGFACKYNNRLIAKKSCSFQMQNLFPIKRCQFELKMSCNVFLINLHIFQDKIVIYWNYFLLLN